MSATEVAIGKRPLEQDDHNTPRKRFKATELPLSPTQRSVIDGLLHTFKKKGEFDTLRKKVWNQYSESADKTTFITSLEKLAEDEIDRDPSLLSRDRGKAATLMLQGAVETSDIYKSVESSLDRFLAEHIGHVESTIREIRRAEVGPDIAAEEQSRANKTDEEYAAEAAVRRVAREEQQKKDEARKRREEEKERLRAEEAKKKAELERLRRREKRRNEEAERAIAREAHLALLKKSEEELERKKQERREGYGREDIDRSGVKEHSHERVRSAHREPESLPPRQDTVMPDAVSPKTPAAPPIDEKDLEAIALERLLDESLKASNNKSNSSLTAELRKGQSMKGFKPGEPSPPKGPASDRNKSPMNLEPPKGPRLSYSKRPLYSPHPLETRTRSRSPSRSHSHHDTPRRDSADLRRPYESEAKTAWKKQAVPRGGEEEGEYRKSTATREKSPTRERDDEHGYHGYYEREEHPKTYYPERDRERERYKDRDHKDPDRYREREREKEYRSSRHARSRSPERRDRESYRVRESYSHRDQRDRDHERERYRDREPHNRSHRDRSRSPTTRSSHTKPYEPNSSHVEARSSRPGDRPRAKSPVEIDRYVPSTSSRAREGDKTRHLVDGHEEKGRDKEREAYKDYDKERERERPVTRDGHKERERGERERYKEKDEYRAREREREGGRHGERERDGREKKGYVEIDRYVPGSSSRAKELEFPRARDGERERDRERPREREREREKEKESR